MPDVPIPDDQMVTVMVAQTTFAVLTLPGKSFRVDFLDKAEAYLKPGARGKFSYYSEHPLLLQYNSSMVSVYINSRPTDPKALFETIQARIELLLQGWHAWQPVLSGDVSQFKRNLLDGSGILLQNAPAEMAKIVIDACAEHNVLTWATDAINRRSPPSKLLLIGTHFVIARDFRFTEVFTEKAPLPGR
ncbi:hypothetical protein [Hymenobacter pini]|uniref:hypothetical protein n=1 Tax=Hymenobacter pini TaxID=2880879 RepID=UPI001CF37CDF|nr:hypothetical protein [Hymenobacter pini]MCA8831509.1 hypothetical protein [Hymenobacter pini]